MDYEVLKKFCLLRLAHFLFNSGTSFNFFFLHCFRLLAANEAAKLQVASWPRSKAKTETATVSGSGTGTATDTEAVAHLPQVVVAVLLPFPFVLFVFAVHVKVASAAAATNTPAATWLAGSHFLWMKYGGVSEKAAV